LGKGARAEHSIHHHLTIEAGRIRSVVEKEFPLSKMVQAPRYYERGHLKGKVVVKAV
jgi:NADPH:quinone reductase-like Zn-dependent oxidoreductase